MLNWSDKFANRAAFMKRSSIREILKLTQNPEIISFAGGLPAPEFFPVERVKAAADELLSEQGAVALQYTTTEGVNELRDFIANRMSTDSLKLTRDNIMITGGAQQAIDLVARVLLNNGDTVLVENPTYLGTLQAWRPYNPAYITIPTDANGLCIEHLESTLRENPKVIYLVPNFQNPQGVTLSLERRLQLVKLIAKYDTIVIEDNPYGELRFSGQHIPSLYELDARHLGFNTMDGHIIYLGTFSKILAPGLRIGWVAGPTEFIDKLVLCKQGADLHTSTLTQMLTYRVSVDGFLDEHIAVLCHEYHQRRDRMLHAMERHFPIEARWSHPDGGLFLMVTLPPIMDASELLKDAIRSKVAFVPGIDFHVGDRGHNTFRLNFSNARPAQIDEGIKRLGKLLKQAMLRQPAFA